ncbi:hypothetical protein CN186_26985 [Sinorhizobium medicae]|uniref:Helix-turn-helix domain-containing protein n=1 Tax=Sinorhizobium medicae TaxID=110321 RepID=A0A508WSG5_9HYPH|nr:hypothetical protein [Sinorhizobium medicae]MDX0524940.1 hypothetical protein [Sinorhizobium medicae]MDX0548605.1 hypothetical protein [Sinorhizobium medicae]MDX0716665.1 hypothetical protein [Sinorhizobium medicae]MDX0772186.1 hypothetical protein [Sinorhizobium medicae]MDX0833517.1 hypothetical protein [Sinorhizobium medicae]
MTEDNLRLIRERAAYWSGQGLTGAAYYEALAGDVCLPQNFTQQEVAEITGFTKHALKTRRSRGAAPGFVKLSRKEVRYPKAELFNWLAERFVPRKEARRGVDDYIQQPAQ